MPAGQWANTVVDFSSEYSPNYWAAHQALGEPNTMSYGDIVTAWAPLPMNAGGAHDRFEHLTVRFANPVNATGVMIRETYGNGFVYQVDFLFIDTNSTQTVHTWTDVDPSQPGSPVDFTISIPATTTPVNAVKIYVDIDHDVNAWEEIDAVQLLDGVNTPPVTNGNLAITVSNVTMTYADGTTLNGISGYTSSGLQSGDTIDSVTLTTDATVSGSGNWNVGNWTIFASAATGTAFNAANYSISYVVGTLTVNPATLTVTADDQSKTYVDANPTLTATITGYVNGEDGTVVSGAADLSTTADSTSGIGAYAITPTIGSLAAANYTFSFMTGTLTITELQLDITGYRPHTNPYWPRAASAATEDTIGVGVRSNGDDDNSNGTPDWDDGEVATENDLTQITLEFGALQSPTGINYFLRRNNTNVKVWSSRFKGVGATVLNANDEAQVALDPNVSYWVEWVNPTFNAADAILTLEARSAQNNAVVGTADSIRVFRFTSVVIAIGGNLQAPTDPLNPQQGIFVVGFNLYANEAYDVYVYAQNAQVAAGADRGTGAAYSEVVNAVNNRRVTSVSVFGYSWGGGATYNLVDRLVADAAAGKIQNPFSIPYTAYIDAVQHDFFAFGAAEIRRPPASQFHVNYFERIGTPDQNLNVMGNSVAGSDFELNVNTANWGRAIDHYFIDDDLGGPDNEALGVAGRIVLNGVQSRFLARVSR